MDAMFFGFSHWHRAEDQRVKYSKRRKSTGFGIEGVGGIRAQAGQETATTASLRPTVPISALSQEGAFRTALQDATTRGTGLTTATVATTTAGAALVSTTIATLSAQGS